MDQDRIGGKVNPSATVRAQECSKSHSSYEDELGSYTAVEKRDFERALVPHGAGDQKHSTFCV